MIDIAKDWLSLILSAIALAGLFYGWLTRGSDNNAKALDELKRDIAKRKEEDEDRVEAVEKRLDRYDNASEHMIPRSTIETKFGDHERRLDRLEAEMAHMPSKDMVTDLKLTVTEIRGDMQTMRESFASVQRTALRIEDFLMKGAK